MKSSCFVTNIWLGSSSRIYNVGTLVLQNKSPRCQSNEECSDFFQKLCEEGSVAHGICDTSDHCVFDYCSSPVRDSDDYYDRPYENPIRR